MVNKKDDKHAKNVVNHLPFLRKKVEITALRAEKASLKKITSGGLLGNFSLKHNTKKISCNVSAAKQTLSHDN